MISVAMAAYNGGKFIAEQIDSILAQTYQDFEIVICDDCSTDNTWDVIQQYVAKDDRIKAYKNEQNLGFRKNFVKAINLCSGEYIALSDQDDVWTEDHLQVLLDNLKGYTLVCADSLLVGENGESWNMTLRQAEAADYMPEDNFDKAYSVMYFRNMFQGSCMLFHRDFMQTALPLPDDICYHDVWFALLACYMDGINYVEKVISCYRMHDNNVTGQRKHKPRSRFRGFCRRSVYGLLPNRDALFKAVKERVPLNKRQERQINTGLRFYSMNKYLCYCIFPIFLMLHHRKIFNYAK
jgi:glycosyltransferase involved in cell wall biosynthesis